MNQFIVKREQTKRGIRYIFLLKRNPDPNIVIANVHVYKNQKSGIISIRIFNVQTGLEISWEPFSINILEEQLERAFVFAAQMCLPYV